MTPTPDVDRNEFFVILGAGAVVANAWVLALACIALATAGLLLALWQRRAQTGYLANVVLAGLVLFLGVCWAILSFSMVPLRLVDWMLVAPNAVMVLLPAGWFALARSAYVGRADAAEKVDQPPSR